ncbi:hypothetical protein QUB19_08405 [Microcoleus sp. B4-C5]|uniref:hypothetical protein n=1 Tax=unclassified Microcoleus TaxID=2642155 RepID=UPI002FD1E1C7
MPCPPSPRLHGWVIVTSSEGDGVGPSPVLREISSSNPVNFIRSPQSGHALAEVPTMINPAEYRDCVF